MNGIQNPFEAAVLQPPYQYTMLNLWVPKLMLCNLIDLTLWYTRLFSGMLTHPVNSHAKLKKIEAGYREAMKVSDQKVSDAMKVYSLLTNLYNIHWTLFVLTINPIHEGLPIHIASSSSNTTL